MLKSIAVVVGTYLLSVALVVATDPLLSLLFPGEFAKDHVPSAGALITNTALFVVVSILCAWLCVRIATSRPSRRVLWFFIVGEVMDIGAIIPNWSKGWPHWYWLSWLLTWPVSCWIGLLLARRRTDSSIACQRKQVSVALGERPRWVGNRFLLITAHLQFSAAAWWPVRGLAKNTYRYVV
jgi:hypothetical protein